MGASVVYLLDSCAMGAEVVVILVVSAVRLEGWGGSNDEARKVPDGGLQLGE